LFKIAVALAAIVAVLVLMGSTWRTLYAFSSFRRMELGR
jgi:hypothetical protein